MLLCPRQTAGSPDTTKAMSAARIDNLLDMLAS